MSWLQVREKQVIDILSSVVKLVLHENITLLQPSSYVGIRCRGKFRGMLLERVQGTTVDKVICTRNFHDVRYVYDMLYSVFTALDRAQGALGELSKTSTLVISPDFDRSCTQVSRIQAGDRAAPRSRRFCGFPHLAQALKALTLLSVSTRSEPCFCLRSTDVCALHITES